MYELIGGQPSFGRKGGYSCDNFLKIPYFHANTKMMPPLFTGLFISLEHVN
jgi:hypothetical protein